MDKLKIKKLERENAELRKLLTKIKAYLEKNELI